MALGMELGPGPDDFILHGDPAHPPQKGAEPAPPQFLADVYCGQTAGWIKMPLGMKVGLSPGDSVLDGDPPPVLTKGVGPALPNFRLISIVAKRLDAPRCHLVWS